MRQKFVSQLSSNCAIVNRVIALVALVLGNVLGSIFQRTREGGNCRPIQDVSLWIKARTVAGAIPAPFGRIPSHDAAQVSTHGGHLMYFTGFVTVDRELREALAEHGTRSGLYLANIANVAGRDPARVLAYNVQVFTSKR